MRWALRRWERARLLNRLGAATVASLEMDYLPGVRSAAYFVMRYSPERGGRQATWTALLDIGRGLQRFWLTATRLGLAMQPTMAILAFSHYGEHRVPFSTDVQLSRRAEHLAHSFQRVLGVAPGEVVFIGRIGEPYPRVPRYRSSRRPLTELTT